MSDSSTNPSPEPSYVVGIGASAGGLEALRAFFSAMPTDTGMAFVVVQHLAPDYKSLMVELLGRSTAMPVLRAEEGMAVRPDHIYLIPPRYNLTIAEGVLHLHPSPLGKSLNLPIDIFFRSLAAACGDRAIAIILSGTGSDGARGIRTVKEAGGMIMVQEEASAKFAGMPSSAIATGTADFVLPVEQMPGQLINFARHPFAARPLPQEALIPDESSELERIFQYLRESSGLDFRSYKHATLARRIERRMNIAQLQDLGEYVDYLRHSPAEAAALSKDLLIGVTKFLRDPESFDALLPHLEELMQRSAARRQMRIWSAACASGEEAYTLAILATELVEKKFPGLEVKVFATDVDRSALEIAGAGLYPRSVVADLPTAWQERYFQPDGEDHSRVQRALRDHLIFARQDLLSDPPFTKIDLAVCRNLLIYLQPQAQRKLLGLLHFSLQPGGLLFLGSSETLGDMSFAFETLDSKHRIYRKLSDVSIPLSEAMGSALEPLGKWTQTLDDRLRRSVNRPGVSNPLESIQQHLLNRFAPATLVCDSRFQLLYTVGPIAQYLQLPTGPAKLDVIKMLPRDLGLAISTAGAQALRESRMVEYRAIEFTPATGEKISLRLQAEPFLHRREDGLLLLVSILPESRSEESADSARSFDLDQQLLTRINELERELQSSRENLQASIEQQETANEELQAANEELLAANEELQSTNEELESVNEELYTVNAEYQGKIQELTELNEDMENFTRSTEIGTLFLDPSLTIRRFTKVVGQWTGLVESDVGRNLRTFSDPLLTHIAQIAPTIFRQQNAREIIFRQEGLPEYLLRFSFFHKPAASHQTLVVSILDISRIAEMQRELDAIYETVDVGICVTDAEGKFVRVNPAYCRIYGYNAEELLGQSFTMVVPEANREKADQLHRDFIRSGQEIPAVWEVVDKHNKLHRVGVRANLLQRRDGSRFKVTVVTDLEQLDFLRQSGPPPSP